MRVLEPFDWYLQDYELVIDARSPSEYAHSHIHSAHNFFALDDAQHAQVGTIYKHNKHQAKLLGASYACTNIAAHLEHISALVRPYARIGVYCARGGQRSSSIAIVLEQVGYDVAKLQGGYKAHRAYISSRFEDDFASFDLGLISLCGNTGVGKSRLLRRLEHSIDLEALARHFGSVFGVHAGVQPSQKSFDDMLFARLMQLSGAKYAFIEAESRKIGKIVLGRSMYEAMANAYKIWCECDMQLRVQRCVDDYAMISSDVFGACIARLRPYIGAAMADELLEHFERRELSDIAYKLLVGYYDKVYKRPKGIDAVVCCDDIDKACKEILSIKSSLCDD